MLPSKKEVLRQTISGMKDSEKINYLENLIKTRDQEFGHEASKMLSELHEVYYDWGVDPTPD